MFTWECPTCGRELDIAESECPNCSKKGKASQAAVATEERPAAEAAPREDLPPSRAAAQPRPRAASSWGLKGKHVGLFGLLALIAIAAAVYLARPDLFRRGPQLAAVPAAQGSGDSGSAYLGEIEVAGVRTWYDPNYKPKVSAVVINHSESAQATANLKVELRTRESSRTATPLGSFEIRLDKELAPREARNIETDLTSFGTLASLPPWQQLRVDLQQP